MRSTSLTAATSKGEQCLNATNPECSEGSRTVVVAPEMADDFFLPPGGRGGLVTKVICPRFHLILANGITTVVPSVPLDQHCTIALLCVTDATTPPAEIADRTAVVVSALPRNTSQALPLIVSTLRSTLAQGSSPKPWVPQLLRVVGKAVRAVERGGESIQFFFVTMKTPQSAQRAHSAMKSNGQKRGAQTRQYLRRGRGGMNE